MALPEFDPETGYLPPGMHAVDWPEFRTRFGWNATRHRLIAHLEEALLLLRAAGCSRAWVNGSFTTKAEEPQDVDVLYEAHGIRPIDLDPLFRDEKRETRSLRKVQFGGDYLAIFEDDVDGGLLSFFQSDRSGIAKGIVTIQLSSIGKENQP
jgi:hypothetical protein